MQSRQVRNRTGRERTPWPRCRALLLLALSGAAPAAAPTAAQAEETGGRIEFRFLRPEAPGDPYALQFRVPGALPSAVLISDRSANGNDEDGDGALGDLTGAIIVPLPPSDGSSFTGLAGIVPESVTQSELDCSRVDLRLVLFDPASGELFLSDPLPLAGAQLPEAAPEEEAGLSTEQFAVPEDGVETEEIADEPGGTTGGGTTGGGTTGGGTSADGAFVTTSGDTAASSETSLGTVTLRTAAGTGLRVGIHDQPTPVQGSGH